MKKKATSRTATPIPMYSGVMSDHSHGGGRSGPSARFPRNLFARWDENLQGETAFGVRLTVGGEDLQ